jgi:hypothetical protein
MQRLSVQNQAKTYTVSSLGHLTERIMASGRQAPASLLTIKMIKFKCQ